MKKIILDNSSADGMVTLFTRIATCDFCNECTKECVKGNRGVDICWDCINQLIEFSKNV